MVEEPVALLAGRGGASREGRGKEQPRWGQGQCTLWCGCRGRPGGLGTCPTLNFKK